MGALFQSRGWLPIVEAPRYFRHPTSILAIQLLNAFECNLKESTTKSAWVPRSAAFGMHMPSSWLHRSCDSLAHSVFPSCWVLSAIFFPSRPPPRLVGFFSTDVFSVWRVPVPFLWCGGSWLGCAVVPVMGALFQSRGWLPIVEAPGYFRHPTSILVMQLLMHHYVPWSIHCLLPTIRKLITAKVSSQTKIWWEEMVVKPSLSIPCQTFDPLLNIRNMTYRDFLYLSQTVSDSSISLTSRHLCGTTDLSPLELWNPKAKSFLLCSSNFLELDMRIC